LERIAIYEDKNSEGEIKLQARVHGEKSRN